MTTTELRVFQQRAPFVPFNLVLPNGQRIHVPHPDFISIAPSGRTAHVWEADDHYSVVDVRLITTIETGRPRRARTKK